MAIDGAEVDLMIITRNGIIIRCDVESISTISRNTQGIRLINVSDGDMVIDSALVAHDEEDEAAQKAVQSAPEPAEEAEVDDEPEVVDEVIEEVDEVVEDELSDE
jgi:DNA gyrase subunit A